MKVTFLISLLVSCWIFCTAQPYRVGTYNIRLITDVDTGNLWVDRREQVADLIRFYDFDVLGTQEGYRVQLDYLADNLPQYARYGIGRDDGKAGGEHAAIFYKRDKFHLIDSGDFWLSETPAIPSMGWDGTCCHRICSWVHLRDRETNASFFFFNVHYDHQGVVAREESSKLILKQIKQIAVDEPAVLVGDFNGSHQAGWYQAIASSGYLSDTYFQVQKPYAPSGSSNGFGKKSDHSAIIDHVFVSKHFSAKRWGLLTNTYQGRYPSDHFPVFVMLTREKW